MFSIDITGSDAFREMPASAQSLYFHLGMAADDDGFLDSYRGLMRSINASEDDLKLLIAKRFLIIFPSKIVVIKHWKINNTVQKDRYHETKHLDEKRALIVKENGSYTECIQAVSKMEPQNRIGKDSKYTADADFLPPKEVHYEIVPEEEKPRKEKDTATVDYNEMCDWLSSLTGAPMPNRVKQYRHLKTAKENKINRRRLMERAEELWAQKFYQENGMDWGAVVNSFNRKG